MRIGEGRRRSRARRSRASLTSAYPGTSKEEKKIKADILEVVFESRSWTKICDLPPAKLQTGLVHVKYLLRCIKDNGELPEPDQFCPGSGGEWIALRESNAQV